MPEKSETDSKVGDLPPGATEADKLIHQSLTGKSTPADEVADTEKKQRPGDETVKVNVDGVDYEMTKDQIAKAISKSKAADQLSSVAQEQLQQVAGMKELSRFVDNLDEDDLSGLKAAMANPALLRGLLSTSKPDDTDDDYDDLALLTGEKKSKGSQADEGLGQQVKLLTDAVRVLLEREQTNQVEKQKTDVRAELEKTLSNVTLFKENDAARSLALRHLVNEITLNPKADPAALVRDIAIAMKQSIKGEEEEVDRKGLGPVPVSLPRPRKAFTGVQMEGGDVADRLVDHLQSL